MKKNEVRNKKVRSKSPTRLRAAVGGHGAATGAKKAKGGKKAKVRPEADTAQTSAPTGEPEAKLETAPGVCPNCGATEVDEDGDCAKCHEPKVAGKDAKAKVKATVVEHFLGEKIHVFTYRPKKTYKKARGHRSRLSRLTIDAIELAEHKEKKSGS